MCGIAVIYRYKPCSEDIDIQNLRLLKDRMRSRGPDDEGEWISQDRKIAFGHRRLSIIDLESGRQPMTSTDGRYIICYNGEIYNYQEIRQQLLKEGYVFKTRSDTEVILNLYDFKKENMFDDLRGMFALALWDQINKKLLLARDPYGIKPLYYVDNGQSFFAASQVKALASLPSVSDEKNMVAKAGFLLTGSIPEPFTTYENIHQVPSGSYISINKEGVQNPVTYADLNQALLNPNQPDRFYSEKETQIYIRERLLESLKYHFVADVPIGIFLSSGIDSSCLVALARECGVEDITTITLGFKEFIGTPNDEMPLARKISGLYNTRHVEKIISRDEYLEILPEAKAAMDQPSIDGINTYLVSRVTKQCGLKVALSGVGADEIFGGYPSFSRIPQISRFNKIAKYVPISHRLWRRGIEILLNNSNAVNPKWLNLLDVGDDYQKIYALLRGIFNEEEVFSRMDGSGYELAAKKLNPKKQAYSGNGFNSKFSYKFIVAMESSCYLRNQLLRDTDWASMANSVEIRTPYVDYHLLKQFIPYMSNKWHKNGKKYLSQSVSKGLPNYITKRKKTGFRIPMENWSQSGNSKYNKRKNHWSQIIADQISEEWFV